MVFLNSFSSVLNQEKESSELSACAVLWFSTFKELIISFISQMRQEVFSYFLVT